MIYPGASSRPAYWQSTHKKARTPPWWILGPTPPSRPCAIRHMNNKGEKFPHWILDFFPAPVDVTLCFICIQLLNQLLWAFTYTRQVMSLPFILTSRTSMQSVPFRMCKFSKNLSWLSYVKVNVSSARLKVISYFFINTSSPLDLFTKGADLIAGYNYQCAVLLVLLVVKVLVNRIYSGALLQWAFPLSLVLEFCQPTFH